MHCLLMFSMIHALMHFGCPISCTLDVLCLSFVSLILMLNTLLACYVLSSCVCLSILSSVYPSDHHKSVLY